MAGYRMRAIWWSRAALAGATLAVASPGGAADPAPVVRVAEGTVSGSEDAFVERYLGLPYAAAPTGDLRWKPTAPPARWNGVRDAAALRSKCPQNGWTTSVKFRDEDCLFLNIYRPKGGAAVKPVLVWLHGGAYTRGSSQDLDGSMLARKADAIIVTVNYRLGVFGFLTLPELDREAGQASGNYGLMDQQAALRWVRSNIAAFRGDPTRVTLMGQSAGGGSVWMQMVSPGARGLFQRAVILSGSGDRQLRTSAEASVTGAAASLAGKLGCDRGADLLPCLRSKTTDEVIEAGGMTPAAGWGPVIDGVVLPQTVTQLIAEGKGGGTPVLVGVASQDTGFSVQRRRFGGTPAWTAADYQSFVRDEIGAEGVLEAYPLSAYATADDAYIAATSDMSTCAMVRLNRTAAARHAVYAYNFDDREAPSTIFQVSDFQKGAYHTFELPYFFQSSYPHDVSPKMPALSESQLALSERIVADLRTFISIGAPGSAPRWSKESVLEWRPSGDVSTPLATFAKQHNCALWDTVRSN